MSLSIWLAVVSVCLLGAMTPGPSLALILKYTLNGGRAQGTQAGIAHGFAVGLYALATVFGLAAIITTSPMVFNVIQWAGAAFLFYLGIQGLRAKPAQALAVPTTTVKAQHAARDGFLMACLNPYAAVFFFALFSQFITAETTVSAKLLYSFTAMLVDMGWYSSVAWLFSRPRWLRWLQRYSLWLERIFAVILLGFALKLLLSF